MNAAGIKLKKVCDTEAASMVVATRTSMVSEGTRTVKKCSSANIRGEMERRIKATLLGWKPGTSPVIVPNSTPSIEKARSNSKGKNVSIIFYINKTYYFIVKQSRSFVNLIYVLTRLSIAQSNAISA